MGGNLLSGRSDTRLLVLAHNQMLVSSKLEETSGRKSVGFLSGLRSYPEKGFFSYVVFGEFDLEQSDHGDVTAQSV